MFVLVRASLAAFKLLLTKISDLHVVGGPIASRLTREYSGRPQAIWIFSQ